MIKFYETIPEEFRVDSLNVVLGQRAMTKEHFLEKIGEKLHFPDYYGKNWDALDECLCDLSWIQSKVVRLVFLHLPLEDKEELKTLLEILAHAKMVTKEFGIELEVIFPEKERKTLTSL